MINLIDRITSGVLVHFHSVSLLLIRVLLAYGFYEPAMNKWNDIDSVAGWFESLGIPFPLLNTYMAATTELLGVGLLALGLFTRYISLPLIVTMVVAIGTVHFQNGFSAGDNGYEIPLYYLAMLLVLVGNGAGRFSIDNLIFKKA